MGEADANHLMGNLLMHSQDRAHHAFIRVASANAPEQENIHLRYLGRSLVATGQVCTAAAYQAFVNYVPPARNHPTYMHVIPRVVQAFTFFFGITAMAIGWLLIINDNPCQHRRLAKENIHLRFLGRSFVAMGQLTTAAAYQAFTNYILPARNRTYPLPTYMHVIPRAIQAYTFFCGITATTIGWLLIVNDNPRHHRHLAKVIMLPIMFASAFAFRMLLLAA